MERLRRQSHSSTLTSLVAFAIVIASLYFGKEVLVPFALALLLSFLLTPPVVLLERLRLGRPPSVLLVMVLAVSAGAAILWMGTTQLTDIVTNLPLYQQNITKKIQAMRNPAGYGLTKVIDSIQQLSNILVQEKPAAENVRVRPEARNKKRSASVPPPQAPITVEVRQPGASLVESLEMIGIPLLHVLEEAAAVLIFTLFMLMQRSELRDRLFRLFGQRHLNLMTTAMDDAARRVSRYLLTQSIVNALFGLTLGVGLSFIGVPNAPFWGVLGCVLRFIPYVGTLVAGICPLILALAVFEGWTKPLMTLGLFATIEMLMSAAVEPWLYGIHTGISSLAILVSAAFWTLLWGPIGLVLSTPLTVCLVVLGRYVAPLEFLGLLLSDDSVLPPDACFYQRLLALDEEEAENVAETFLKANSVSKLYDYVLIPALSLAERDRHENNLDIERESFIYRTTRNLIEEIADQNQALEEDRNAQAAGAFSVLCVPARDEADELACCMLSHLLQVSGFTTRSLSAGTVENILRSVREIRPDVLFVSALPPFGLSQTRSLCRKIRAAFPDLKIMVGFWNASAEAEKVQKRLGSNCFDTLVTSLCQAETQIAIHADELARSKVVGEVS